MSALQQWLLVIALILAAYGLHCVNDHDELQGINWTKEECGHGCYT